MPFLFPSKLVRQIHKKSCKKYSKKEIEISVWEIVRVYLVGRGKRICGSLYIYVQNSVVLICFLNHFTMKNKLFCAAETIFFCIIII